MPLLWLSLCSELWCLSVRPHPCPPKLPLPTLGLDSELPSPQLSSGKNRNSEDGPRATQEGTRGAGSGRRPDRVSFRGQYTGGSGGGGWVQSWGRSLP